MLDDSLSLYLKEIKTFPLLTLDEEKDLIIKAQKGNKSARDKLINCNQRLVVSIANKHQHSGLSLMDLIQEGNFGLIAAIDKFELSMDYKFSTYASWWIKQTISRALDNKGRLIRLPSYMVEEMNKFQKTIKILTTELNREPSIEEISKKMNLSQEQIQIFLNYSAEPTSLDTNIDDDDEATLGELIADTSILTPEESLDIKVKTEILNSILNTLEEREKEILQLRYGLTGEQPKTLEEIGKKYKITKERIRQIEAKALQKLRNPLRAKILRNLLDF